MARGISTNRLIAGLGLAVVVLGAVAVWASSQGLRPIWSEETAPERVLRQAVARLGPDAEVRLIEQGRGPVVCGYVASGSGQPPVAFVSRPHRILLSEDPLNTEFRAMMTADCPGFPEPPTAGVPQ